MSMARALIMVGAIGILASACNSGGHQSPVADQGIYVVVKQHDNLDAHPPLRVEKEKVVRALAAVKKLNADLLALPPFPAGVFSCPMDDGSYFELDFVNGEAPMTEYRVERTGCRGVYLGASEQAIFWTVNSPEFLREISGLLES